MATHLDLEEQEQLDQLKDFWKQYGNLITWALILALGAFAAWHFWQRRENDQALNAAVVYEELDRAAQAGDVERTVRLFGDLKDRYPKATFTEQGALLAAKVQYQRGQVEPAIATLTWVADNAPDLEYRSIARLRLSGLLADLKRYDDALKWLATDITPEFDGLAADRRGDILITQGKRAEAAVAYQAAWKALDPALDYRRVVQTKLEVMGLPPEADKADKTDKAASAVERS